MKFTPLIFSALLFFLMTQITDAQTPKEFVAAWKPQIIDKPASNNRHTDIQRYLKKLKNLGVEIKQIGKSFEEREIYQVEWGKGKIKVFMWSQMHGDEPTATPALIEMFAFLQKNRKRKKWVKELEKLITIRGIPMLNPDGAEVFKRRNAQNIDINRDTENLETPEANILLKQRNEWQPDIGFNLHNQQELTSVGKTTNQATISILAVAANPETPLSEGQFRNRRISSLMIQALNQFIKGNIGRYDDTYTPNAFGDTFSDLGTPTILIETGGLHGQDEMYLAKLNFIAYLTALQSIATGSEKNADISIYGNLPENSGGKLHNYMFRNATIIQFAEPAEEVEAEVEDAGEEANEETRAEKIFKPYVADVAVQKVRRRAEVKNPPTYVSRIGNLKNQRGLIEFDVADYYIITDNGYLNEGTYNKLLFYKKTRKIDWRSENLAEENKPDGIFSNGDWIKPLSK